MPDFGWDEKYSVGIQSIDEQHKEIFRLMDQLFQALKSGKAAQSVLRIIAALKHYAITHFEKEEYLFRQFKFEDSASHIREHEQFIEKITALKADAKSGRLASSFELLHFLKIWINHHIMVVDKGYSECFQKNGLR